MAARASKIVRLRRLVVGLEGLTLPGHPGRHSHERSDGSSAAVSILAPLEEDPGSKGAGRISRLRVVELPHIVFEEGRKLLPLGFQELHAILKGHAGIGSYL